MNMKYPRILIFTLYDIFEDNSSVSFTVRSFLEKWPRENIIQVLCEDFNSGQTGQINKNLYRLGHKDIAVASWLINGTREVKTVMRSQLVKESAKLPLYRNLTTSLRRLATELYGFLPYRRSFSLDAFIAAAAPDIIYCNTSSPRMYKLSDRYSKKLKIPFFPHIMDDWPNIIGSSTKFASPLNYYYKNYLTRLFRRCPAAFCISKYMCEEYALRYKYNNFFPLMHSVEKHEDDNIGCNEDNIRTIIYAGSLYLERNLTIIKLAEAIEQLNVHNIRIVVYAPEKQWEELEKGFASYKTIEYGGFVSQQELEKVISNTWGLALIESFDPEMLEYTRLSMSTKVPEYLASGKPILAIGNEIQGSIRYIKEYNAGYVATDMSELHQVVKMMIEEKNISKILENAKDLFEKNHRRDCQQELFLKTVMENINEKQ